MDPIYEIELQDCPYCRGTGTVEDEQGWHLTPKGFLVSNRIIGLLQDELAREKNRRLQAAARGDYRMV